MRHPSQRDRGTFGPCDTCGYGPSSVRSNAVSVTRARADGQVKDGSCGPIRTFYYQKVGITRPPSPVNTPLAPNEVSCSNSLIDFTRGVVTARS
jgi:hypothetical protein